MAQPSRGSTKRVASRVAAKTPPAEPNPVRWSLEDELQSEDFATRGWKRLFDVVDYFAHLVDGRTSGLFATNDRKVFLRLARLATVLKASLQWYASDQPSTPEFVTRAEKYLAEEVRGRPIVPPTPIAGINPNLRTGPVLQRKGGKGAAGRLHALASLRSTLVALLEPLSETDLRRDLNAYRLRQKPTGEPRWLLPRAFADEIFCAFAYGALTDLLREQNFRWEFDAQMRKMADAIARHFEDEVRLAAPKGSGQARHLEKIAEQATLVALRSIGLRIPKDLFRDRRTEP